MTQDDSSPILLPLDGAEMSEFAAPFAAEVAAALSAPILVARIVKRTHWTATGSGYLLTPGEYAGLMDMEMRDAESQTQRVAGELQGRGLAARPLVEEAAMPAELLAIQTREHAALVVMATHARAGLARMTLGSVADQIVRQGRCPTLLVRARGRLPDRPPLARALVPLDGSALSELALATLSDLAGRLVKEVTLAHVIDPDERSGAAGAGRHMLAVAQERVEREMQSLRGHVESALLWGGATEQILDESRRHDLIIMSTHGQRGATRWAFGSVADEVLREVQTPLLLTHPQYQP